MNEEHRQWWEAFRQSEKSYLTGEEFTKVCELHAEYMNHKYYKPCTCSPKTIQKWINDLNKIYLEH